MFQYKMTPTGKAFHESDKFVKMICGPYGSGKSCCCAIDVLAYACAQAPAPDKVRYTRVGIIRASYPELTSMTRKSLLEVLPPSCGSGITSVSAPLKGMYIIPLPDGTTVNLELNLYALQDQDDCAKILSANWSFAWINEATGVSPEVFNTVMTRIGRYPSLNMGGVSWGGILMDFNQPGNGTWLDVLCKDMPDNYALFRQPPAAFQLEDAQGRKYYEVNPDAENLRNLGSREEGDPDEFISQVEYEEYLAHKGRRYYRNQIDAALRIGREDVVQNQYCMLDVPIIEGRPVYSNFSQSRHVALNVIEPVMFHNILLGVDQSGIHPAAVILQNQQGKWCIMDELYAENEGLENFLHGILVPLLRSKYATNPIIAALDPSNQRDSFHAVTPKARFEEIGIPAVTEITNSPKARIQTVEHMLNREVGGLLISPTCEILIRGFTHEYRYRKLRASGSMGAAYTPTPEKNSSSHIHDALQYAALLIFMGAHNSGEDLNNLAYKLSEQRAVLKRVV